MKKRKEKRKQKKETETKQQKIRAVILLINYIFSSTRKHTYMQWYKTASERENLDIEKAKPKYTLYGFV